MATALNHAPTPILMAAALNHAPTPTLMAAALNHAPTPTHNILMAAALNHTPMLIHNFPVIVITCEETETSSLVLGKKLNLKELRLASEDLLADFFTLDKNSSAVATFIDQRDVPKSCHYDRCIDHILLFHICLTLDGLDWPSHSASSPQLQPHLPSHSASSAQPQPHSTFSPQPQPSNGSSNNNPPIDPRLLQAPPSFPHNNTSNNAHADMDCYMHDPTVR
ncbi:uncharacterized protein F5147DRAFT_792237 [Suillus discolor]|uniref:Uncharacterized protein n=1 Tax=Suillus discolor TaxID=1912936 RepID=A0A9P7JR06_9AGAM|nr:uncharacterized protein F5147DRAFT_776989 [Suillus discolor]XP_041295327.1 uncharacterized protein F5147DRAFT_792237 [Suillus discolor]KAG2100436.1 hypothetical protein F5147DRAFT_776989 [Suillus discolor]KAG2112396.1 hypothetical protein F5147DRAFT_792237 [Suillus discolor]